MGFCSPAFRALMRRNLIYRKRKPVGSLMEIFLPAFFIGILVIIKKSVESTDGFKPELIKAEFATDADVIVPYSFQDYVTAIQAKRMCIEDSSAPNDYVISGMPTEEWMVPFVKCNTVRCRDDPEADAREKYCEYNVFAVAPEDGDQGIAKDRVQEFEDFVYARYPQLDNSTLLPGNYPFIKVFSSSKEMEKYVKSGDYGKTGFPKVAIGVVFSSTADEYEYAYTIRTNSTNFNNPEEEGRPAVTTTPPTDQKFSSYAKEDVSCKPMGGAAYQGRFDESCTGQYMYNGALTIQRLVDDFIIDNTGAADSGYVVAENGVQFVRFPTKEYTQDGFYAEIAGFAPLIVTLGLLYPVASVIRAITMEKELKQKELMKIMSVTDFEIGFSWFLIYFVFHFITTIAATILTSVLYPKAAVALLFIFWLLTFMSAVVIFGMFISSWNSKSTRATLIGILFFFIGYFLTLAADYETGSAGTIDLVSYHPVAAFAYGLQEIGRLEDASVGVTFDTFNETDSPSEFTFEKALNNLFRACVLWGILSWYLNRVVASDYGQPLPWNFPCTSSYWCNTAPVIIPPEDGETESTPSDDDGIPNEPVSDALKEQEAEGRCIQIKGLRKQFGEKTAVDGLNLSMYNGQITALLGHNGAGKTTTISMLTGMVKPTSGHAIVAGRDTQRDMNQIRKETGICLQHDCLFPLLTVREHLQFFSRIKGLYDDKSKEEAEASITQSIEDVALLEKSNSLSNDLSGGMKRKLSVAIAFCGDSKTVLLDEPTSGMDPFSRRFTWNVIRQYREGRTIILTTHFMDEADILGDRIAIMAAGQLRCSGSSLFLKKSYGVGYQLTIEKNSRQGGAANMLDKPETATLDKVDIVTAMPSGGNIDNQLRSIVKGAVKESNLLSSVGTELSFQLPIGASSQFKSMFDQLDKKVDDGEIVTYGVGVTTLEEVFLMVARGDTHEHEKLASSRRLISDSQIEESAKSYRSRMDLEENGLFSRHVRALFKKRAMNFKRDKKAWCCSVIVPSLFTLVGLVLFKFAAPDRNLGSLTLTLDSSNVDIKKEPRNPIPFNNQDFKCMSGFCDNSVVDIPETNEKYSFCGPLSFAPKLSSSSCTISQSVDFASRLTDDGAEGIPTNVSFVLESSKNLLETSKDFQASQYGGLYFGHDMNSEVTGTDTSYSDSVVAACQSSSYQDYRNGTCDHYKGIGYVVSYNYTSFHASMVYQALADAAIVKEAVDDRISISATIHPLPITRTEKNFGEAEDAFTAWFLMVLSFPFITGAFATFVVAERLSKAKHLQTVAGVKPSAYWISTYIWDIMNYQFPLWITVLLFYAFGVKTFTTSANGVFTAVIALLFLFGPASAGFTYCITFLFKSPSMCNLFVIIFNFMIGLAGPMVTIILRSIGGDPSDTNETLIEIADTIDFSLRFIPSFCFGRGLLSIINIEAYKYWEQDQDLSVWDKEVMLWDVIFLIIEGLFYIMLAIQIDIWSTNPKFVTTFKSILTCSWLCGSRELDEGITAALPDDEDVQKEAERVKSGDAIDDLIVLDQMTKQYSNGKLAVNNVSYGIPRGECFGLLGINGAGKTTTMGMLTAEFPPTSGDAILASFSVTKEPEKTRRRIGYCPQFDAHFTNMSGREHVELYASIKGVPSDLVKEAAAAKLEEVGLSEFDSDRLSMGYSGGMKRKLSVACATIGQPQIVFLDEPSTGMDPVARRDMWGVISDMVVGEGLQEDEKTSVILTTHSMEECEALCPRIGIMANGKLRCLGSAQHLKTRFGQGYQVELKINDVEEEDEDYKDILAELRGGSSVQEVGDEEKGNPVPDSEEVFLNVDQVFGVYQSLTGDDYLSSLVNSSDPTGYVIWKSASSETGAPLEEVADFATQELRMKKLKDFFEETYPQSVLRERQDNKARYEVGSEGLRISSLFGAMEENKSILNLSDYGISQTSLEQVFNMHAAEAEKLKQGTDDG
eukprot:CAMPEP_0195283366 /NCGR_PEP_ID=MMETSP0707-20130614/1928_1 /TAXON_ID=33640 /ORGANISM="Asterionellopsis glacialis, Strain CCMP134" /LENGTH=1953 /DNA_ID=CAMNT_0040342525 /DNA_START=72 /DNA_END=5933 /DNA_ORIENTATION=+